MFGMGWPNFISVLSCALILANPVCRGAVWTAEDQARALSQGRGRLPSAKLDTSKAKIWTKLDETRAKNTGQGRLRHVTPDFAVQGPQFDARKQDGAAFDDYPAKKQDRGQSPQFEGRTQGGAAQNPQHDGLTQDGATFDERKQDRGRFSSPVLPTPHVVGKIWTQEDEDRARNLGQGRLRHVTPDLGGQVPQFDGRIQDGDAYDGRTQAEIDYDDYLREELENEAKVKDSAAENARFDAQKPQINGRPQDFGAQITEFDGRTQAELDYLEYLRAEQQFENNPKIAKIVLTDNAKNARFDAPTPQFNGRPIDFSSPIFQIDGRTQAELDYLEYLRAEKQFENDAKIKDSATEHGRLEDHISHLDGRPQDTGAHIDGLPQAELDFLEYLRAEQQFQNVKISQNDGRTQAELEYLEYLRAEQLENDAKIKDSAAENARIKEVEITEEPISDLRAEQLETDAKIKDSAAENARIEEVEIIEEPISDEPVCLSCHLFDKKQDEKPVEVQPQKAEPERECLSCHLFDEPASDEGGLSDEPASALPLPEVDTKKSASGGFQDGDAYDGRTQAEIDYLDYLREEQLENEAKVKESAAVNVRFEPASALPLPEVDTRKSASGESEGGYLQDTLNLITGIFQGEGTGRNPAPVNPRFGVHNQDANLKAVGQTQNGGRREFGGQTELYSAKDFANQPNYDTRQQYSGFGSQVPQFDGRIQDGDAYHGRTQAEIDYLDYLREEQLENEAKVKDSSAENARFGEQIPSQAELQYLEYRQAEQEEELEIDGILEQLESDEILDFDFEYRQSLLDANTQESFHDRSPYENLDLPDSFNTRFGGQREDKSATAARFGAQRQDQPASFDTRHSGQRQDQPASFDTRHSAQRQDQPASFDTRHSGQRQDQPASLDTRHSGQRQDQPASFVPRQYLPASFDTRHSGSRLNQPASANFGFRGQIRDQPASANSRFGGQSQDQYVTSNTRFRGQKQDQFPSSNTRFGGQIQRQPRVGDQPASGFGDHSDLVGSNIDAQKKIDAEFLAYEAELAEQRAAQTAYEAELAKQRAAQKAYEDELGNQRAAQTAYEDELAKQRAAQTPYQEELGNQRAAQKAYEDELAKQRAAQKAYEDELGNQRAAQKAYEDELAKQRAAQKAYEDELGNQRAAQTAYEDELAKQRAAQEAYEAQVGNLQQENVQTFEGGHRVKVAKLMDVDEEETLSAQPQRSRPKGGCRSCFLLDEF